MDKKPSALFDCRKALAGSFGFRESLRFQRHRLFGRNDFKEGGR